MEPASIGFRKDGIMEVISYEADRERMQMILEKIPGVG